MRTLVERLGELDAVDFRVRGRTTHSASEIACMTICAQIAGATRFSDRATRFKTHEATQKGHGRVTKRTCCQTDYLEWFADRGKWAGLASVVMIDTECLKQKTGETTKDRRFFISSLPVNPKRALELAVSHWDIENPLHWTLDMVFDEDHSRASSGFAAENLAILRHLEFNLIRRDKVTEGGMSRKKKMLTWNEDKLLKALFAA